MGVELEDEFWRRWSWMMEIAIARRGFCWKNQSEPRKKLCFKL